MRAKKSSRPPGMMHQTKVSGPLPVLWKECGRLRGKKKQELGRIGCAVPSICASPSPAMTKISSSFESCMCSRTWQPGSTVWVPKAKGVSEPVLALSSRQRTKPLAGTGCQKLRASPGSWMTKRAGLAVWVSGIGWVSGGAADHRARDASTASLAVLLRPWNFSLRDTPATTPCLPGDKADETLDHMGRGAGPCCPVCRRTCPRPDEMGDGDALCREFPHRQHSPVHRRNG